MVTTIPQNEWEVLKLICEGKTYKEMALILNIEYCSVNKRVTRLLEHLGAVSQAQAVNIAYQRGILRPNGIELNT